MPSEARKNQAMRLALYIVSEADPARGVDHLDVAAAACAGAADVFQLRVKDGHAPDSGLIVLARQAVATCRHAGVACIINDYPEVALAAGADGVHVGGSDLSTKETVRLTATRALTVGASATNLDMALRAVADGAHYLGVGPVFATPSKGHASRAIGLEGLRTICSRVGVPVVAIGGITLDNLEEVIAAGAEGVAVISAVTHTEDMAAAVRRLRHAVDEALERSGRASAG